jgi:hypothetical protein
MTGESGVDLGAGRTHDRGKGDGSRAARAAYAPAGRRRMAWTSPRSTRPAHTAPFLPDVEAASVAGDTPDAYRSAETKP